MLLQARKPLPAALFSLFTQQKLEGLVLGWDVVSLLHKLSLLQRVKTAQLKAGLLFFSCYITSLTLKIANYMPDKNAFNLK